MGFEALIRLKDHPISPAEFIEVAEEKGLIIDENIHCVIASGHYLDIIDFRLPQHIALS